MEEQQALLPLLLGDQGRLDVGDVLREQLVPRDPAAGAPVDRGGEPDVIGVLMGEDQELDVLDPEAVAREPRLERGKRLRCVGPGVDERERVAPEEPAVDGTDGERRREDDRLHRQAGGATTIAGSAANAKNGAARASSSARPAVVQPEAQHRRPAAGPGRAIDLEDIRLGSRNRLGSEREHAISRAPDRGLPSRRRTAPSRRTPGRGSAPRPASRSSR